VDPNFESKTDSEEISNLIEKEILEEICEESEPPANIKVNNGQFSVLKICHGVDSPDLVTWTWRIYGGAVVNSNTSKISGILTMDKNKKPVAYFSPECNKQSSRSICNSCYRLRNTLYKNRSTFLKTQDHAGKHLPA